VLKPGDGGEGEAKIAGLNVVASPHFDSVCISDARGNELYRFRHLKVNVSMALQRFFHSSTTPLQRIRERVESAVLR
jgi:hypothetical protein